MLVFSYANEQSEQGTTRGVKIQAGALQCICTYEGMCAILVVYATHM